MARTALLRWALLGVVSTGLLYSCGGGGGGAGTSAPAFSKAYYIDCGAAAGGDGTQDHPWNALAPANAVTLNPNEAILLRKGSTCTGMLEPHGSGTSAAPVVIGAYGHGALPRIDGGGAVTAAVHVEDMSHLVVQDLELTNAGNTSAPHRGVYLTAKTVRVSDVTIRGLHIHDVQGSVAFNDTDKSGGAIIPKVIAGPPALFDGVLIEDNQIEDVGRSGIFVFGSDGSTRPRATDSWPGGSVGIVVRHNTLTRLQGDGIVADGTVGALIEDNVVSVGNLSGKNYLDPQNRNCSAGIWAFNSNSTLIQRNEVFDFVFGQGPGDGCDGTAFDIDYDQDDTIIQFNYSHGNEGGFILLCSDDQPRTGEVRYNLSIDDAHSYTASPCKAPTIGGFDGLRVYNNTWVADDPNSAAEDQPLPSLYNAGTFVFANNILYGTSLQPNVNVFACGDHCSNNVFFNLPPAGSAFVTTDPLFANAALRGQGRLTVGAGFKIGAGSPAIGAGIAIADGPATDYFGNPISSTPAIGMHQR